MLRSLVENQLSQCASGFWLHLETSFGTSTDKLYTLNIFLGEVSLLSLDLLESPWRFILLDSFLEVRDLVIGHVF